MGYRRQRDEWDEFMKQHGPEVRDCGVPDEIVADKGRFLRFLDHGYDEGVYAGFDGGTLTDEQIARLAELVGRVEPYYQRLVSCRWRSA